MRRLPKSAAISAAYGCRSFGPKPIPQTNSIITVVGQMGMRRLNAHTAAPIVYLFIGTSGTDTGSERERISIDNNLLPLWIAGLCIKIQHTLRQHRRDN